MKVKYVEFAVPVLVPTMESFGPLRELRADKDVDVPGIALRKPPAMDLKNGEIVIEDRHYVLASGVVRSYEV